MIKTFEEFINENYNEMSTAALNSEEFGAPLFNEVSESLMSEINNSINEGKLVIDTNMIEEGIFSTIGSFFKKGTDLAKEKINTKEEDITAWERHIEYWLKTGDYSDAELAEDKAEIEKLNLEINTLKKIEDLYASAEEICNKFAQKEDEIYKTISEKMSAANDAVKEFTEKAIANIKEIVETSKNKVNDAIAAVMIFFKKMSVFAKNAMKNISDGGVIAFTLPFILVYSVYRGTVSLCNTLIAKSKDGAKFVKETFSKIKTAITNWVVDMLNQSKELLKNACDAVQDGAKKSYDAIGKAYLAIVAMLGQLASEAKDKISDAYNNFVNGVKDMSNEVKSFVSTKWDIVSKWCKRTSTAFADGVKNVWDNIKDKVTNAIKVTSEVTKDTYETLKDNANATWNDIKDWSDEKQQDVLKATLKYAVDKWGEEEVKSWI